MTSLHGADTEAELLERVAAGDTAAFAEIYDRHSPTLYRLLLSHGSDGNDAERILQKTFLGLWFLAPRLRSSIPAREHLEHLLEQHHAGA
ncbi:sigma factor [Arenivirga flava]|uniref:RNA polymerase sigma-70 region 2 domain-containing protein n=1 Tax=Arenivirga flava TaxID=1930060 RepID=A0AA37UIF6_9MICO|nr:sigma factor [Arenivirga flava]GMA29845.1 hypothetical protein GCM10025874_30980 [Arenivirga flava]